MTFIGNTFVCYVLLPVENFPVGYNIRFFKKRVNRFLKVKCVIIYHQVSHVVYLTTVLVLI